jgi:hypothetical protein
VPRETQEGERGRDDVLTDHGESARDRRRVVGLADVRFDVTSPTANETGSRNKALESGGPAGR